MKHTLSSFIFILALVVSVSAYQQSGLDLSFVDEINREHAVDMFTPDNNVRQALLDLIEAEPTHIRIAMYFLIDPQIIKALKEASLRDVRVDIVIDPSCPGKGIEKLGDDVHVNIYDISNGIMHHKFILLSGLKVLGEGSYNFTYSAQNKNRENFSFYLGNKQNPFCQKKYRNFSRRFKQLLGHSVSYEPDRMINQTPAIA